MTSEHRAHTRAFLFADLRGYSAYTERHGDEAAEVLIGRYRALVRKHLARFDGAEIRTEGDSFYVVFDSVTSAVEAALAIRDAARVTTDSLGLPIPVGMGLHAGESRDGEHGIVSSAVNIAARVCARARPDEVLVTDTVRSLTRTALPVAYLPTGRRRLKGISEPIALYRVERAAAARPQRSTRVALAVSVVALSVAVAAVIGLRAFRGDDDAPRFGPSISSTSETLEATHDLGRFFDAGEYPNDAEAALLDQLPSEVALRCDRAEPDERPTYYFSPADAGFTRPVPLLVRLGLDCLTQGTRVFYWQASGGPSGIGNADELLFNVAERLGLSPGSCATASRKYEEWEAGAHAGHLLCYISSDGSAVIEWSFAGENVYAVAERHDGSSRALYEWWREVGRLLGR